MIFLYFILLLLIMRSLNYTQGEGMYNDDFISKETSNIVKGICIWVVFICHISGYIAKVPCLSIFDNLVYVANHYIRQLLVVPFLFYSGYGVMLSLIKKGDSYGRSILKKRCLTTLLNFDIAVLFFVVMNLFLSKHYELETILLAFTGWTSIGNSNWYIFCILMCYLTSWVSYRLLGVSKYMLFFNTILVLIYSIIMYEYSEGPWWYDTVYSYAAGCIFAWYKDDIICFLQKNYKLMCVFSISSFLLFYNIPDNYSIAANLSAISFCLLLLLFTCKFQLSNSFLEWSGCHLFPLYIYQRLPMIFLSTVGGGIVLTEYRYFYVMLCFCLTIIFAFLHKYINIGFKKSI